MDPGTQPHRSPVGSPSTRLIVIRGNSGSGKSALAAGIREARAAGTVAVVGQDVIRRVLLGTGDDLGTSAVDLVDTVARFSLARGFDVVVEGILNAERYGDMLRCLARDHRGVTRAFLYDLTFEETVRRHATKGEPAVEFGPEEMRDWWHGFQPIDGLAETRIGPGEVPSSQRAPRPGCRVALTPSRV